MNLEIAVLSTVREPDGLAMSSRNVYLSAEQRRSAVVLHQSLMLAQKRYDNGETDAEKIRQEMTALIQKESPAEIDYISIANNETVEELATVTPPALVSLAVKYGNTRLIDNVLLLRPNPGPP